MSKLTQMAGEARRMLEINPEMRYVYRKLSHGLEFVLQREGEQWRLALAREGVYPSAVEVQVMRNAFDVPVATEEVNKQKPRFHPKTGRLIRLHLIEMEWIDRTVSHTLERSAA